MSCNESVRIGPGGSAMRLDGSHHVMRGGGVGPGGRAVGLGGSCPQVMGIVLIVVAHNAVHVGDRVSGGI